MTLYPPQLEGKVLTLIVDIVRRGQIVERKDEFGLAIWNVQGVLQGIVLGIPPQPVGGQSSRLVLSKDDLSGLKDLVNAFEEQLEKPMAVSAAGCDPTILVELVKLILLIFRLLK